LEENFALRKREIFEKRQEKKRKEKKLRALSLILTTQNPKPTLFSKYGFLIKPIITQRP
jgi:hypothetical protein